MKSLDHDFCLNFKSRSREGAWIEIHFVVYYIQGKLVAPVRERGLKLCIRIERVIRSAGRSREGAWIEIKIEEQKIKNDSVAPVRERGLKSQ